MTGLTQFDYLLNAVELASHATTPADHGYAEKRKALFDYVRELERIAAAAQEAPAAEVTNLPPIPEPARRAGHGWADDLWTAEQMRDYASDAWKAGYKHGAWASTPAAQEAPADETSSGEQA